jgi:integrase
VRQARVHIHQIKAEFGGMRLSVVRPSHVKAWYAKLRREGSEGGAPLSASYVYALHNRLAQIMGDAVHDGIVPRSPCSRRTSPKASPGRTFKCTACPSADGSPGLPAGFRYHDLRHYFASLLIAKGADVKIVQARLRHGSAKTTLDTYGHLWPDKDESTMAIVDSVFKARFEGPADSSRTAGGAK